MRAKRWMLISVVAAFATLPASGASTSLQPVSLEGAAGNQATFKDPKGDAPASADIAKVIVSSDDVGFLSFRVVFVRRPTRDVTVLAYLDTDRSAATGAPTLFGADYQFAVSKLSEANGHISFRRWNGTAFEETWSTDAGGDPDNPNVNLTGRVLRFAFPSADTIASSFRFAVATKRQPTLTLDRAPNPGRPPWSFKMKVVLVRVSITGLKTRPRNPRAGRTVAASMGLKTSAPVDLYRSVGGPGSAFSWTCKATLAGKPLADGKGSLEVTSGLTSTATTHCTWRIPPHTSGKLFRGSVNVVFRGRPLSRSFSVTITQ